MEFVRTATNPWGQQVLVGLAWNVLWLVVIIGALFIVVHAIFHKKEEAHAVDAAAAQGIPAKVMRHSKSARLSHWTLAIATFTLLITAFVPILGLKFPWLTIHWIAGLVFGAYVVYHIVDTLARGSWGSMWVRAREIGQAMGQLKAFLGRATDHVAKSGKWNFENKAFHHITALAGLGVLATGLLMFTRVDTWFWVADPYRFGISDSLWGLVYVLHGTAAVGFVGLLIAHIYFALRPEKLFFTRSMFKGWITREEFAEHYDPAQWRISKNGPAAAPAPQEVSVGAAPGSSESRGAE